MTLATRIKNLPHSPGVYRFLDAEKKILYIGKAKNLRNRVRSYLNTDELNKRIRQMMSQAVDIEITETKNELEALILESNLVAHLQPPFNILLKDDKSYAFLKIDKSHPFPSLVKYRGIPKGTSKEKFFGPYPQMDDVLETVQKIFKIRNCSDYEFSIRKRPCLQYEIKRCTAPCVGYVSEQEYEEQIKNSMTFLEGHIFKIMTELSDKMRQFSKDLEFEKAAECRDMLGIIKKMNEKQGVHFVDIESCDVLYLKEDGVLIQGVVRFHKYLGTQVFYLDIIGEEAFEEFIIQFYKNNMPGKELFLNIEPSPLWEEYIEKRHGIKCTVTCPQKGSKKRLLDYVGQTRLNTHDSNLKEISEFFCRDISRIEAYDNSHLFSEQAYGVLVVFGASGFDKKYYRKFKVTQTNDYDMMEEVITRRLKHEEWPLPDMMLIDGGIALVRMVKKHVPPSVLVLGLAKGEKRKQDRLYDESGAEILLSDPMKYFLQNIRDESHRFAITTHRAKREGMAWKSTIDQIPGIGLARKKVLLKHFGSVENVKTATLDELKAVKGLTVAVADAVFRYFHG